MDVHDLFPFRALVEQSPIGVCISRAGRFLYINPAVRRMYRIPAAEDVTGVSFLEFIAPAVRDDARDRNVRRERDEPSDTEYETTARRADGTEFPVHIRAGRVHLPDGPATAAFLTDITARRRAEAALRSSEARFRRMAEANLFGVTVFNADGRITWSNDAFLKMLGYTHEEFDRAGLRWDVITPPEYADLDRRGIEEILATGTCRAFEKEYFRKDGTRVPILIGAVTIPESPSEGICFIVDLSEQKRSQAMLRESEEKFRALAESSPTGIWEITPDRRTVYMNPAMVRMVEADSLEQASQGSIDRFFTEEGLTAMRREHDRRLKGETTQYEVQLVGLRGTVRNVVISGAPLFDTEGRVRGMMGTFTDVTEQYRLKEQLLQAQKMEAVGVLAGGIAHDFNNLLAVISGYSESLSRRLGEDHPLTSHAEEIRHAAERGGSLVKQLLTFSRRQSVETRLVDLSEVIGGLHNLLHRVIRHDIRVEVPSLEHGLYVKADPGHLEQVVLNLALNARDAMPHGGTLTLSTRRIVLDEAAGALRKLPPGAYAKLTVIDTGVGMDEETRRRVFEPFFTTKGTRGTGLGMSIVYSIAEDAGGRVMVESHPGKGTRFDVLLPAHDPPTAPR